MNDKYSIGERIRTIRIQTQTKQRELARHLSVTNSTISNWENGRRLPSIEELKRIAIYFDISLDFFSSEGQLRQQSQAITQDRPSSESSQIKVTVRRVHQPTWMISVGLSVMFGAISLITQGFYSLFMFFLATYLLLSIGMTHLHTKRPRRTTIKESFMCPKDGILCLMLPEHTKYLKVKSLAVLFSFLVEILMIMVFFFLVIQERMTHSLLHELVLVLLAMIALFAMGHRFRHYHLHGPFRSRVVEGICDHSLSIKPYLFPLGIELMMFVMISIDHVFETGLFPLSSPHHTLLILSSLILCGILTTMVIDGLSRYQTCYEDLHKGIVVCPTPIADVQEDRL
ncbi:MAG: helix-turn-helix domain-containing protein [Acholeplasmataceae bacterium]|nr:helix-turn-helix domain-containing protein [Acholeplasmataceae bacterium]